MALATLRVELIYNGTRDRAAPRDVNRCRACGKRGDRTHFIRSNNSPLGVVQHICSYSRRIDGTQCSHGAIVKFANAHFIGMRLGISERLHPARALF